MPKQFRTKIVEIEATKWTGNNYEEMWNWTDGCFKEADRAKFIDPLITAEVWDFLHQTWIGVKNGQWIVRGAKGEFYPCDDETFHWKYEEVVRRPVATKPAKCPYEGKHQGTVCFSDGDTCRHCGWTL